jgi:hypothetical protein
MRFTRVSWFLVATLVASVRVSLATTWYGPQPYHSVLDSPFHYIPHNYFYVEDFEDGALNTPGLSVAGGLLFGPSTSTDSVDGDDGHIDGSGAAGHSYWSFYFPNGMTFTFSVAALGNLPTMAGIVWTDVGQVSSGTEGFGGVVFEAFDQNGVSLGTIGPVTLGDGFLTGEASEDRFFGVENAGGISKIKLSMTNSYDFEMDHVQYGYSSVTGVADGNTPALRVSEPFPNPSSGVVSLSLSGKAGPIEARVYDVSGGLVRTLDERSGELTRIVWDGRDSHGARVPSGVYFLDVRDRTAEIRRRVSILH